MSIVHPPLPHQPFSDLPAQLLAMSSPSSPTAGPSAAAPPVLPHRHTAPVPDSPTQSFSALGPGPGHGHEHGPSGLSPPPPPAPKHEPTELPSVPPVARDQVLPDEFPPTPDLDAPQNKVIFPHAMIKLAPPAEVVPSPSSSLRERVIESAPSPRAPLLSLDHLVGDQQSPTSDKTPSQDLPAIDVKVKSRAQSQSPQRPKAHRAHTSIHVSSSRNSHHYQLQHPQYQRIRQHSAITGLPRPSPLSQHPTSALMTKSYTDEASTPVSSRMLSVPLSSTSPSSPDLGPRNEIEAKMSVGGAPNVGKTSLAIRFTRGKFTPATQVTIGQGLFASKMTYNGVKVKLQIWDTAGQESHRSMSQMYYRGSEVSLLVYDISDRTSLPKLQSWMKEVKAANHENPNLLLFVVGAKLDLENRRQVQLSEACSAVRRWTSGTPPSPEETPADKLSPPVVAKESLLRSSSTAGKHTTKAAPPKPITPTRSYSHDGLSSMNAPVQSATSVTVTLSPPNTSNTSVPPPSRGSVPFPLTTASSTSSNGRPNSPPPPCRQSLGSPTYTSFRELDKTRTPPTSAFTSEFGESFITPASPPRAFRHGISAGRFSFSGLLGFGQPAADTGGAISTLSRFAEENHVNTSRSSGISAEEEEHLRRPSFNLARNATSPSRPRHESGSMLHVVTDPNARRKSDDWSSRTGWRMSASSGMSAAERLSEFGEGVRRKQSGDMLANPGPSYSHLHASSRTYSTSISNSSRSRAGSLGRDSRLYGSEPASDGLWGVDVNGIRVGECSSLSGEGVDHLFKTINILLVDRKEAISREQTIRRHGSIRLHVDDKIPDVQARGYCCT